MKMKRILTVLLTLILTVSAVPLSAAAESSGTGYCSWCQTTCAYTVEYEDWTDYYHCVRYRCSNCGSDQRGGAVSGDHVYDDFGRCILCGHGGTVIPDDPVCLHTRTDTSLSGCEWYMFCADCGLLISCGTNHSYSYGPREYLNDRQHRCTGTCVFCGAVTWTDDLHSVTDRYESVDPERHRYGGYCEICGAWIGGQTVSAHNFRYGYWKNDGDDRHRRLRTCADCGYSDYEYAGHSLRYGSWEDHSDTVHRRSAVCSDCGLSRYEYEDHSFTFGLWQPVSGTQHRRTASCICGRAKTEIQPHIDADGDGRCDDCGYQSERFSVTVPSSLTVAMSETGRITTATGAAIVNGSTGAVEVSALTVTAENGWSLVPFSCNMARERVDSRLVGFSVNNANTTGNGRTENMSLGNGWSIAGGASLPLSYDAVISPVSEAVTGEQILTLVFVVRWA